MQMKAVAHSQSHNCASRSFCPKDRPQIASTGQGDESDALPIQAGHKSARLRISHSIAD